MENLFDCTKSPFYNSSLSALDFFKKNNEFIKPIKFPYLNFYTTGDTYFRNLWEKIDDAQDYVWFLTYTFDNTFTAKTTMIKLIEAQKRGVNCVLMIDDLNNWVDLRLRKEFEENGGLFYSLNPVKYFWNIFTKEFFRRHHEKITVIDDTSIIGSSNIADDYGSIKYGSFDFFDLNMFAKNTGLQHSRLLFLELCEFYKLNLHPKKSNAEIVAEYDQKYSDSEFINTNEKFKLIKAHPTRKQEIQNHVINMINNAKREVIIIQPYYLPIKKIERAISDALKRGVKVELITSAKRDQPVYAPLKNLRMTGKLVAEGLQVYEMHDKFLHMKAYYVDDEVFTLGSFNNDKVSWKINNEANIYIENANEAYKLKKIVIEDVRKLCKLVNMNDQISIIRRLRIWWWEFFLYCSEWAMDQTKYFKFRQKFSFEDTRQRTPLQIFMNPNNHSSYDFDFNVI